jgi:hypothetical protein
MSCKARHSGALRLVVARGLSVWFAGTAAMPGLLAGGLTAPTRASWFTVAVQLGFAAGTLLSAILSLADRHDPRLPFLAPGSLGCVVADSAQFSACIVSLSPPDYVGTMPTAQTSLGSLLTAITIGLLPATIG